MEDLMKFADEEMIKLKEKLEIVQKQNEQLVAAVTVLRKLNSDLNEELLMNKGVLYLLKNVCRIDHMRVEPNDLLSLGDKVLEELSKINIRSRYDFAKNEQVYEW